MYVLGIDLGTTYTAAATWRDGRVEIASLGSRGAVIPSVVLLRDDETFLIGETANRRALTEPDRVAREFKRRLGDPTPILLGGVPYAAEGLTARLLRWVVDEVSSREGGQPTSICVSHPANWGQYKLDLLQQAVRRAGLEHPVSFTTEPAAAATFYAEGRPIPARATVAVYDLGGGTFDAAVLRKSETGFELLGRPEGIERLGGIDFDAAVFNHVSRVIGDKLNELDEHDPAALAAVARLREECVEAKEALSTDTDVSIPVLLPNLSTEVRLTRAEFEGMIRPVLHESIEALGRALRSANVSADGLHAVLLVGGSSRIPLVSQLVGTELGRPVAVDAHPKHAVALGAAWVASRSTSTVTAAEPGAAALAQTPAEEPVADADQGDGVDVRPAPGNGHSPPQAARAGSRGGGTFRARRPLLFIGGIAAAAVIGFTGWWLINGGAEDGGDGDGQEAGQEQDQDEGQGQLQDAERPADEQCSDEVRANDRWVCITRATIVDGELVVEYDAEWAGEVPNVNGGFHVHFYGADDSGANPPAAEMGAQATNGEQGPWYIEDRNPSVHPLGSSQAETIGDAPKICARVANSVHELVPGSSGGYDTGNCWPIRRG